MDKGDDSSPRRPTLPLSARRAGVSADAHRTPAQDEQQESEPPVGARPLSSAVAAVGNRPSGALARPEKGYCCCGSKANANCKLPAIIATRCHAAGRAGASARCSTALRKRAATAATISSTESGSISGFVRCALGAGLVGVPDEGAGHIYVPAGTREQLLS